LFVKVETWHAREVWHYVCGQHEVV
jgi:hypothetical protein